jgi:lipoprotein-releasing system ATP-binding protein
MLLARDIYKTYKNLPVLKGINVELSSGELVALIGASGAGKTTLLQIIGLLDSPNQGEIWFENQCLTKLGEKKKAIWRNQKLGFIFQFHHLISELTALDNVLVPAYLAGKNDKKAKQRALDLLTKVNLKERIGHKPAALSGGEQQRVAIARALMNDPFLILADEPTGNLDSENSLQIYNLFREIASEHRTSFLIATHNAELANAADRRLLMKDGELKENQR